MQTYHIETTLPYDGALHLEHLPFHAGDRVEVSIRAKEELHKTGDNPLRGSVLKYERPTDPVCEDDYEALQ